MVLLDAGLRKRYPELTVTFFQNAWEAALNEEVTLRDLNEMLKEEEALVTLSERIENIYLENEKPKIVLATIAEGLRLLTREDKSKRQR